MEAFKIFWAFFSMSDVFEGGAAYNFISQKYDV